MSKSVFFWAGGASTPMTTSSPYWFNPGGAVAAGTASNTRDFVMPFAATISNLYVRVRLPGSGTGVSVAYTLFVNGSGSTLTCSRLITATDASDLAHSVSLSAGDVIGLKALNTGGNQSAADGSVECSAELDPTTAGLSCFIFGAQTFPTTTATTYLAPSGEGNVSNNTNEDQVPVTCAGTISRLYIHTRIAGTGGAGTPTIAYTLRVNGVDTALTVTMNNTATDGSDTNAAHAVSVVDGDLLSLKVVPSAARTTSPQEILASFQFDSLNYLAGTGTIGLTATGELSGDGALAGTSTATLAASGTLTGAGALAGTATMGLSGSATLTGDGELAGTSSISLDASGTLHNENTTSPIAGDTTLGLTATGTLTGTGALAGTADISLSTGGTLTGSGALAGAAHVTLKARGTMRGAGALAGTASMRLTATGTFVAACRRRGPPVAIRRRAPAQVAMMLDRDGEVVLLRRPPPRAVTVTGDREPKAVTVRRKAPPSVVVAGDREAAAVTVRHRVPVPVVLATDYEPCNDPEDV